MLSNPEQPKIIVRDLDAKWHFIIEIHLQMTPNPGLTQKFNFFVGFVSSSGCDCVRKCGQRVKYSICLSECQMDHK